MRLLILTTAINRPEIHSLTFPKMISNLNVDYKWLVNIDNYMKSPSIEETINNLPINCEIYISENPCFYSAVKKLYLQAEKYLNTETFILWLEDDWLLNKEINFKELLEKYNYPNLYMSLAFNEVGTFPPHIIGPQLVKYIIQKIKVHNKKMNPESMMGHIMEQYILQYGCRYFLLNYPIDSIIKQSNKMDFIKSMYFNNYLNRQYYLVTNYNVLPQIRKIVASRKKSLKSLTFKLQNTFITDIINVNDTSIIVIKFGSINDNRIFIDLGLDWKKKYNIEHTHYTKKN